MDFQTLPNVLWFQLQRWRMEASGRPMRNLFHEIRLDDVVRLRAAEAPQTVRRYILAGVVCHLGAVPQAGHYVAKARHEGVWYRYDDVRREEVRPGQPLADAAEKRTCSRMRWRARSLSLAERACEGCVRLGGRRVLRTPCRWRSIDRPKFREPFRLEKSTGRRKKKSRPFNDSS